MSVCGAVSAIVSAVRCVRCEWCLLFFWLGLFGCSQLALDGSCGEREGDRVTHRHDDIIWALYGVINTLADHMRLFIFIG